MRRIAFLLCLPKGQAPAAIIRHVQDPAELLPSSPAIWVDPQTTLHSEDETGLVLGHVFSRATFRPACWQDVGGDSRESLKERAQALIDRFWGAYFSVFFDREQGGWMVMPDPSGLLPVYRMAYRDMTLFATDPELFARCTGKPLAVSYADLTAHLMRPELRQRATCLVTIDELAPGRLIPVDDSDAGTALWHAPHFAAHASQLTCPDLADELRQLCTAVIGAWSEQFGSVTVATSGGVDSSIICAAAHFAGHRFGSINLATIDPSGDERTYARAVAEACNAHFVERLYDPAFFDPAQPASAGLPRPGRRAFLAVLDQLLADAMLELGGDVVFDGNNGDNVFCFLHSAAPLVDRIRAEGVGLGAWMTLTDMCRITGCSVPTMLRSALRRLSARSDDAWPPEFALLDPEKCSGEVSPLTPWLPEKRDPRTGWRDHLLLIMHAQNHVHGVTTALPRFSPLASQPITEFCLGVPTWHWAQGGRNRAIARAAFADILPQNVLARTSKAGPDSFMRAAFSRNKAVIAERLLEGQLAAHGIIDRVAVKRALETDPLRLISPIDRLLDLLEAENWARSWGG